jgi:dolichol-phosphate mannosyltransferase
LRTTIIIPTYNEAENLPKLVSALFSLPLELNILVVDDNSPDGTGHLAEELASSHPGRIRVMHRPVKMGLRSAYMNGFQKAIYDGADAIVQMDADFSHDPNVLIEMIKRFENCDLLLGSRYMQGGSVDVKWPVWRKWLSAFGNLYSRTILGFPLRDVTTGYRIWRRETLLQMPLERIRCNGYVFQVEMVYLAYCLDFRIAEYPIYFPDRQMGKSKMSMRIQLEAAFRIWQVWWGYRDLRRIGRAARL